MTLSLTDRQLSAHFPWSLRSQGLWLLGQNSKLLHLQPLKPPARPLQSQAPRWLEPEGCHLLSSWPEPSPAHPRFSEVRREECGSSSSSRNLWAAQSSWGLEELQRHLTDQSLNSILLGRTPACAPTPPPLSSIIYLGTSLPPVLTVDLHSTSV